MAVQTIYLLGTAGVTPNFWGNTQLNGSAPTAANSAFGWGPAKTAVTTPYYRGRLGATTTGSDAAVSTSYNAGRATPQPGTGTGAATAGDSFVVGPLTGTFAATAWTFNFNLRAGTAGAIGHVNMRMWRGTLANGSNATQVVANTVGATVTLSTSADVNSSITASPGQLVLNNEYLFFQVEWQETTAGSSNSDNVFFRIGTASITTADYVAAATGTVAVTEISDTIVSTGRTPYVGTLAVTEISDTIVAAGGPRIAGTLAVTEISDTLVATAEGPAAPIAVAPWPPAFPQHGAGQSLGVTNFAAPGAVQPSISGLVAGPWPPAFPQHRAGQTTGVTNYTHPGAVQPVYQIADTGIVNGNLSRAEIPDILTATGTVLSGVGGNLSQIEALDTITAAGNVPVIGNLSIVQASQTISSTGTVTIRGTLSQLQAPNTLSAVARATVTGTLNLPQANNTISATGTPIVAGTLNQNQANNTIISTGTVVVRGVLNQLQANQIISSTGAVLSPVIGTLSVNEAADSVSATGTVANPLDVVLLCHFDTGFIDFSNYAHKLTPIGNVILSGANPKFGSGSANYVIGNGANSIDTGNSSDFYFGAAPFTIEAWCYATQSGTGDGYDPILAQWDAVLGNVGFFFNVFPQIMFFWSPDGNAYSYISSTGPLSPLNAWHHVAADRDATGFLRLYLDGAVVASGPCLDSFYHSSLTTRIGNDNSAGRAFPGYIDEIRVVRGTAVYGGAFTPPTAPFPNPLPSGFSGSLNVTQANQIITSTGTIVVSGALNQPQANNTIASTGTVTILGTLSQSQAPNTLSAVVRATVSGTLNVLQAPNTLSAIARTNVTGTLGQLQPPNTLVATGSVLSGIGGALNVLQASQTLTAAGNSPYVIKGDLSQLQAPNTLSAVARVTVTGTLGQLQPPNALVATGSLVVSGTLSRLQATQTITTTGTITVGGVLNRVQVSNTIVSTGVVVVTGTLNQLQLSNTLSATGSALSGIGGALDVLQASQTISATGSVPYVATLNQVQASNTIVATASLVVVGTLNRTQANNTVVSEASAIAGGVLNLVQDNQSFIGTGRIVVEGTLRVAQNDNIVSATCFVDKITADLEVVETNDTITGFASIGAAWFPAVPGVIPGTPPDRILVGDNPDRLVVAGENGSRTSTGTAPNRTNVAGGNGNRTISVPSRRRIAA
jgi:hypothetical protein